MAQRYDDDQRPPASRRPGRWDDFVPQMLANAAGTVLAATVLYLYGVAVGAIRANWRLLAPIIVAAAGGALFFVKNKIDDRIDERFKGPGVRRLIIRNVLSSLYGVPIFALIFLGLAFWSDRGLPGWAYIVLVFGLALLAAIVQRIWRSRRHGFAARSKASG